MGLNENPTSIGTIGAGNATVLVSGGRDGRGLVISGCSMSVWVGALMMTGIGEGAEMGRWWR